MAVNIRGNTDWQDNPELQAIQAQAGTKLGDWKTDPQSGWRYMDTEQFGRIYDNYSTLHNTEINSERPEAAYTNKAPGGDVQSSIGSYYNQNGDDKIYLNIDAEGKLTSVGTNRESNADRNAFLAAAATLGVGGALYGGAAVAGGGAAAGEGGIIAGASGGGSAAAGAAGAGGTAASGSTLTAAELASINGAGVVESGSLAAGGYTMPAAASAGSTASTAADIYSGANSAADAASYADMTSTGLESSSSYWDKLFGFAKTTGGGQIIGGIVSGIGQGILAGNKGGAGDQKELLQMKIDADAAEKEKDRAQASRNFQPGMVPKIDWGPMPEQVASPKMKNSYNSDRTEATAPDKYVNSKNNLTTYDPEEAVRRKKPIIAGARYGR